MKTVKTKTWASWPTSKTLEWPFDEIDLSFPMKRPREGKAKLEKDLIDDMTDEELISSMPILENEEMWSQRVIDEVAKDLLDKIEQKDNNGNEKTKD